MKNCNHAMQSFLFWDGFFWPVFPCPTATTPSLNLLKCRLNNSLFMLWTNNQTSLHIVRPLTLNPVWYSPESPLLLFLNRWERKDIVGFLSLILVVEIQFWGMYVLYRQFHPTLSITTSHTQQLQDTFIISRWKGNIKWKP